MFVRQGNKAALAAHTGGHDLRDLPIPPQSLHKSLTRIDLRLGRISQCRSYGRAQEERNEYWESASQEQLPLGKFAHSGRLAMQGNWRALNSDTPGVESSSNRTLDERERTVLGFPDNVTSETTPETNEFPKSGASHEFPYDGLASSVLRSASVVSVCHPLAHSPVMTGYTLPGPAHVSSVLRTWEVWAPGYRVPSPTHEQRQAACRAIATIASVAKASVCRLSVWLGGLGLQCARHRTVQMRHDTLRKRLRCELTHYERPQWGRSTCLRATRTSRQARRARGDFPRRHHVRPPLHSTSDGGTAR